MSKAIDNLNSACRMINTSLITIQGSRLTLVVTVMTEGKITVATTVSKITDEVDFKIAKFLVVVQWVERSTVV